MKILVCETCGHIEFNEAPEKCLVCRSPREAFQENSEAIEKPGVEGRAETDDKHIPKIVVNRECGLIPGGGCLDVHVKVGEVEHPMLEAHFIRYIDYYLDYRFISRIWLSPEVCHPAAALHLKADSGTVTVIENCNKHGNWMSETTL